MNFLIITVHELGHFITAYLLKLKVKEIKIFMFGGVTILDESLSIDIKKEIITLLMGPLTQILFLYIIYFLYTKGYVSNITFTKFLNINILLLSLNLLPILPLDGGKLLNNTLDLFLSYNLSHKISIFISTLSTLLVFTFDNKIFIILLFIFLCLKNIEEISTHKYRVQKLILERKLNYHKYKRTSLIKNIKDIKRNKNFYIEIDNMKITEKDYFKYYMKLTT